MCVEFIDIGPQIWSPGRAADAGLLRGMEERGARCWRRCVWSPSGVSEPCDDYSFWMFLGLRSEIDGLLKITWDFFAILCNYIWITWDSFIRCIVTCPHRFCKILLRLSFWVQLMASAACSLATRCFEACARWKEGLDDKKILGAGILKLLLLPAWPSTSNSWPQTGKTWETNGNQWITWAAFKQ